MNIPGCPSGVAEVSTGPPSFKAMVKIGFIEITSVVSITPSLGCDLSTKYLAREFTGSAFQPYITTINLYQENDETVPVATAKLPKPIRKSDRIAITFKIKLDF